MKPLKSIKELQEERRRLKPVLCWGCSKILASRDTIITTPYQYYEVGELELQPLCKNCMKFVEKGNDRT